jgi:hypothetical protein
MGDQRLLPRNEPVVKRAIGNLASPCPDGRGTGGEKLRSDGPASVAGFFGGALSWPGNRGSGRHSGNRLRLSVRVQTQLLLAALGAYCSGIVHPAWAPRRPTGLPIVEGETPNRTRGGGRRSLTPDAPRSSRPGPVRPSCLPWSPQGTRERSVMIVSRLATNPLRPAVVTRIQGAMRRRAPRSPRPFRARTGRNCTRRSRLCARHGVLPACPCWSAASADRTCP